MTGRMSSRRCDTKLNFDFPYVRSVSLRRAPYAFYYYNSTLTLPILNFHTLDLIIL